MDTNSTTATQRLQQQIAFILEIDKLKSILRQSYLVNGERRENTAEHSWHLAMMALMLSEHANEPVDLIQVVKMVLIHDIVEIDAGDTFAYDERGNLDKREREEASAERIFGLLPADQQSEIRELWEEFEAEETADAKFATSLDRLMPLLHNYHTQGVSWQKHGIRQEQVLKRNGCIDAGSNTLWRYAEEIIQDAVQKGYLAE